MTKKGTKGTYHKPKPRVAVYLGAAGSVALAAGATGAGSAGAGVPYNALNDRSVKRLGQNLAVVATDVGVAAKVAVPAAIGVVASVGADKLGVNKLLAKMKSPWRI